MRVGGQLHAPAALLPGKRPGTHCIGGWVGPRAGLDGCGKSRPHRIPIRTSLIFRVFDTFPAPTVYCIPFFHECQLQITQRQGEGGGAKRRYEKYSTKLVEVVNGAAVPRQTRGEESYIHSFPDPI
jgi:hypothetical protein